MEEDLLRDIAHLKRTVPGVVASRWVEGFVQSVKVDEGSLAALNAQIAHDQIGRGQGGLVKEEGLQLGRLGRQTDVETGYEGAVRRLGRLQKEMPGVAAKMGRARATGEYVLTER